MEAKRWGWRIAPVVVLVVAALLRFWSLHRPETLVFDELYYVRDAISQLAHGFPTRWPDDSPDMSGHRATGFTDEPSNAVHPPLGKWLIACGILLFGPESGWGWRSAVALSGVATVAVTMRLGWLMSRSMLVACTAGLLLAVDGVHVVLTRVGLLDGFLTFFIALGSVFMWRDIEWADRRPDRVLWARPWLIAAAVTFGAAAAVKWSGLYPFACFLVFVTVRDLVVRRRRGGHRPTLRAAVQAGVTAVVSLPLMVLTYVASWIGWIANAGGWGRDPGTPWPRALVEYHAEMLSWHSTLDAEHPFQSHPLTWPLALRPTAMYEVRWREGCRWAECVSGVSPLPNPLVTWGGAVALVVLVGLAVRSFGRFRRAADLGVRSHPDPLVLVTAFVTVGYLSGWLPWVFTFSRSAVFQFYAVVLTPFSAIALAVVLGLLFGVRLRSHSGVVSAVRFDDDAHALLGRRIAVALFLVVVVVLAAFFFPLWTGAPVADWFWQAHLWLPGWE